MLCFPNCKINLGLFVTQRRPDGYHDIETVFYPLGVNDVLEIVPAANGGPQIHLSGLPVSGDKFDNLAWKAYTLLEQEFPDRIPAIEVFLHKVIPMGAGLGGGSADGSFMLRLLNDFSDLGLNDEQLMERALSLGSDCPFFIKNKPQFATGRGEQMTPVEISLSQYSIQLVCPRVHVSTKDAFAQITPRPAAYDLRNLSTLPPEQWAAHIGNDFEQPVFSHYPVLAEIKARLIENGALYAAMSGSGSTIFGIFPKKQKATWNAGTTFTEFYVE